MEEKVVLLVDIRALRTEAKMPQDTAAKLMGVVGSTLNRCEQGESPSLLSALKIARFMKMPVEEIWTLTEEEANG